MPSHLPSTVPLSWHAFITCVREYVLCLCVVIPPLPLPGGSLLLATLVFLPGKALLCLCPQPWLSCGPVDASLFKCMLYVPRLGATWLTVPRRLSLPLGTHSEGPLHRMHDKP
jgi:hypothetical protein